MTATQIPTRMLVLVGAALLVAAAFLVARPLLLESDDTSSPPPAATTPSTSNQGSTPTPRTSTTAKPTTPKVVLLPGLPAKIDNKLHHSRVIVVSAYAGTSAVDRAAVRAARRGAKASGAGFLALNVLDESTARELQPFMGTASPPVLLVVRRPGKIVNRFNGVVDDQVVAQAARNAGARAPKTAQK